MSQPPVIQIRELTKVFQTDDIETHALRDIQLTIEQGEFLAIVGPSGSGRSTLLSILGLMDRPTRGELLWGGSPVGELADAELSRRPSPEWGYV